MVETQVAPKNQTINPNNDVHICYANQPHLALCGARLKGIDTDGPLTCKACEEIENLLEEMGW